MKYIADDDYKYITNKYHDASKPFNGSNRFICNVEIFDSESGLAPQDIVSGISENDKKYVSLEHSVRKAMAFKYVLENTRISCCHNDRFPGICSIDRPLGKALTKKWWHEIFNETIPDIEAERSRLENEGCVAIWPDFDHSVPVWEKVIGLGYSGLIEEAEMCRINFVSEKTCKTEAFFDSIKITYSAIVDFIQRLSVKASVENPRLSEALSSLSVRPPRNMYEVLLTIYVYFMLSEHIEGLQVRSLSNLDRLLYPYYCDDRKNGVPEETIREDLAYFFLQFTAIGNYWNQPLFLGGTKASGESEINEMSYIILDVYDKMGIYNPKIQIKLAENTPKEFICKALDMIRHGHNCIVFVCEETITESLIKLGATKEQACTCNITGCYEYSVKGGYTEGMNYFNLMKPLEYALNGGHDGINGRLAGLETPLSFSSFDEFYTVYLSQLSYMIDNVMRVVNGFEGYLCEVNPTPMLSATFPTCLERAKDAICGGSLANNTSLAFGFLASLVDSLTAIKKFVFDDKVFTMSELREMLKTNFVGNEFIRQKILTQSEHYGNNSKFPDKMAKDITDYIADYVVGKSNSPVRGGKWSCSFHVARMSYTQAKTTATSPDGRLVGEELSKNISAVLGRSKGGATAAILSATSINAKAFVGDACLDLGIHPSAVQGSDGLEAMYGLLETFRKRGGHAIHINVFDAATLREAQKNPDKYADLQIRVCGWNVLFNRISSEEQEGFIKQAEALI